MDKLTNTIENKLYSYQPGTGEGQFMPIFEDGQLANRGAFIAYKLRRAAQHAGSAVGRTIEVSAAIVDHIQEA